MHTLTPEGRVLVEQTAGRHNVSTDAVMALLRALDRGGGSQAQFSHPDLGGMGQWSRGGMIMVGDMFNNGLKARVDYLCNDLSDLLRTHTLFAPEAPGTSWGGGAWWPVSCGTPSSSGSQNDMRYACFPETRRLAIQSGGVLSVYDTGDHRIGGVSQQQSGGQDLTFTSQYGTVRLHDLALVRDDGQAQRDQTTPPPRDAAPTYDASPYQAPPSAPEPSGSGAFSAAPTAAPTSLATTEDDVFSKIERLHTLQQKGILSDTEFAEKKKELLARL